ncbi:hypothetical protein BGZ47_006117 [Haplosporangium gracile]|nr:hypothetical protein BGZ47_006117 [Haplosporangium gracile]
MNKKQIYESSQIEQLESDDYEPEKAQKDDNLSSKELDPENSTIEAVRLVVPLTDDPTLVALTFYFWVLSFFFAALASIVNQYYYFRTSRGGFPLYFVNLTSYVLGVALAKILPQGSIAIYGHTMSLNPGPFNIKEHALIGIAVSTASITAYAIDIITAMDLFLKHRMGALGAIVLIITTQCLGYGIAGVLRKYLVNPAEMAWWSNLVHVVFYNAIHNTNEFKTKKLFSGTFLSYWVIAPIIWMKNILGARTFSGPLTPRLFHSDGQPFDITPYLNDDFSVNDSKYNASAPVTMTPMYALVFMYSFIALTGCISHITCFHGADIWKAWKQSFNSADVDVHARMVKGYPEVPQI